jgi:hypothetical protein
MSLNSVAQSKKSGTDGSAVKKGNVIIDGFYGFPNLFKSFFKAVVENPSNINSTSTVKVYGIGPVGGNFQYLIDDHVGLLLEGNYMNFGFDWKENYNTGATTGTYNYKIQFNIIRVMAGGEYHGHISEKLDLFGSAKIGVAISSVNYSDNDPNFDRNNFNFRGNTAGAGIATRFCGGLRYFPIKPIGFYLEGGFFGGGIVRAGLSIKL